VSSYTAANLRITHPYHLNGWTARQKPRSKVLPSVRKDQVCDHLRNLNIHRSMGPDEMHCRVLRELADVAAKPFPTVFDKSCQSGEVPGDWKKGNIPLVFKRG